MSDYPYADRFAINRVAPPTGHEPGGGPGGAAHHGHRGGRLLGDGEVLGHDVLR